MVVNDQHYCTVFQIHYLPVACILKTETLHYYYYTAFIHYMTVYSCGGYVGQTMYC